MCDGFWLPPCRVPAYDASWYRWLFAFGGLGLIISVGYMVCLTSGGWTLSFVYIGLSLTLGCRTLVIGPQTLRVALGLGKSGFEFFWCLLGPCAAPMILLGISKL